MARLPQPGGDSGNWGTILNDYLSQSHAADGTLKPDSVTAATIADGAIQEALLDPALQSKINATTPDATTTSQGLVRLAGDLAGTAGSPTVPALAQKVDRGNMSINIKDYGAKGDGATDDTASVAAAVAALPVGGALYCPTGTYNVSLWPTMPDRTTIYGDGPTATKIMQTGWSAASFIVWAGSLAGSVSATLSANMSVGTSNITVSSTAGLTVGSYYILGTTTGFSSLDPTMYKGEMVCIKSINSATSATIYGAVRDFYSTAASSTLHPVTFKTGVGIRDISIENTQPGVNKRGLLQFYACKDVSVHNVHLNGGDIHGLQLNTVINASVSDCHIENGKDDTANGFTGYGINVTRTSENIAISNCRFTRVRHGFTCDGTDGNKGVPRNITVTGCVASECTAAAFDTHSTGASITFSGCSATRSAVGFQLRSKDTRILGCSVFYCNDGIYLNTDCDGSSVVGTVVRSLKLSSTGRGIKVDGSPDRLLVQGCTFDNLQGNAIEVNSNARRMKIIDNLFSHLGGDGTRTTAIAFSSSISNSLGHVIANNKFIGNESATSSEASISTVQMQYAVDFGTGSVTSSYVVQNLGIGLGTGLVNNAGTNTVSNNVTV